LVEYSVFLAPAIFKAAIILLKMSAAELLEQVKALPPRERHKFVLAVITLEEESASQARPKARARRVKWPDVEARARRIFGERALPNLVLLEREEAAF
jgi:hypothetical protein